MSYILLKKAHYPGGGKPISCRNINEFEHPYNNHSTETMICARMIFVIIEAGYTVAYQIFG